MPQSNYSWQWTCGREINNEHFGQLFDKMHINLSKTIYSAKYCAFEFTNNLHNKTIQKKKTMDNSDQLLFFADILESAKNPLHQFILRATVLQKVTERLYGDLSHKQIPSYAKVTTSSFHRNSQGTIIYPDKESGGVAGLYYYLLTHDYEIIFANDLGLEIHGIDAVAKNKTTGHYIICESKGTSLSRIKTPAYYLKKTKHKGRQLSWEWCWASLVDFAETGTTAYIFLELVKPFLSGAVERLLSATLLKRTSNGFKIKETKIWQEPDFQAPWLTDFQFKKQKDWLNQIGRDLEDLFGGRDGNPL